MPPIDPIFAQRAVTAAGTPERIKEGPEQSDSKVIAIHITTNLGNAGAVYVTDNTNRASASTVSKVLNPGDVLDIDVSSILDAWIDLSELWIDAANSGDGINYIAVRVIR